MSMFEHTLLPIRLSHSPPMVKDVLDVAHGSQALHRSINIRRCALLNPRDKHGIKVRHNVDKVAHARDRHSFSIAVRCVVWHAPSQTGALEAKGQVASLFSASIFTMTALSTSLKRMSARTCPTFKTVPPSTWYCTRRTMAPWRMKVSNAVSGSTQCSNMDNSIVTLFRGGYFCSLTFNLRVRIGHGIC